MFHITMVTATSYYAKEKKLMSNLNDQPVGDISPITFAQAMQQSNWRGHHSSLWTRSDGDNKLIRFLKWRTDKPASRRCQQVGACRVRRDVIKFAATRCRLATWNSLWSETWAWEESPLSQSWLCSPHVRLQKDQTPTEPDAASKFWRRKIFWINSYKNLLFTLVVRASISNILSRPAGAVVSTVASAYK